MPDLLVSEVVESWNMIPSVDIAKSHTVEHPSINKIQWAVRCRDPEAWSVVKAADKNLAWK